MNLHSRLLATILCALLASSAVARTGHAESRNKQGAESHYNKGMRAYTLGHFQEAIEEFEKAYELKSEPIFLYNIAQSHRQNNNPQRAIFFYRRYLEAAPNAKNRANVEKRILDLQSELDAQKEREAAAATPIAPPPPVVVAPPPAPSPPSVAPPPPVVVEDKPAPVENSHPGRGLRIAGVVVGGVGVAAAAAGIILAIHGNSLQDDALHGTYDDAKLRSSDNYKIAGWVAIGVGAAAVGTGTLLYILGARSGNARTTVAIAPMIAPGAGGAAVLGRF
jgi:tetratricopeptide (TPR) repeat protein